MLMIGDAIAATAKDLVESLADLDIRLDGSEASLAELDQAIEMIWGKTGPAEDVFDGMVWGYGCYVADVVQRHRVGDWAPSEDIGYDFVSGPADAGVNPWVWIEKRFQLGDLLAPRYRRFVDGEGK